MDKGIHHDLVNCNIFLHIFTIFFFSSIMNEKSNSTVRFMNLIHYGNVTHDVGERPHLVDYVRLQHIGEGHCGACLLVPIESW